MRRRRNSGPGHGGCLAVALAVAVAVAGITEAGPAAAQQPTAQAAPVDPLFAEAQKTFEALPEADRRAVQDDLIWTGDFTGAATGGFGPLTFRAIVALQKRSGLKPDGILQPKDRAALAQTAAKARDAVRFTKLLDGRSGARIGVPQKLLDRTRQSPDGTVFASADGTVTLELTAPKAELQPLYDLLRADGPKRKVTYKVLRPDWFVVSGEGDGRRFYTRVAQTPAGLRGYTLSYPVARAAEFDRISIAVANSFEPVPGAAVATAPATPGPSPGQPAAQAPGQAPATASGPLLLSGFVTGPGQVVTVAAVEACPSPLAGRQPAKILSVDKAAGLAVLDVPGLAVPAGAVREGRPADGEPLVVLAQAAFGRDVQLAVVPAEARMPESGKARVFAPLQRGAAGAAVFDRSGALVGLVASLAVEPRLVAGVMPQASWPLVPAATALAAGKAQASAGSPPAQPLTAGAIAAAQRGRVVAVECR
ncbi:peptidoglycan-binding protein [Alsobacter sp. R-9]